MRCLTRVTAPACFGVNGSFTKNTCCTVKTENSVVVFLVHIKDITGTEYISTTEPRAFTTVCILNCSVSVDYV